MHTSPPKQVLPNDADYFARQLARSKKLIDAEVETYWSHKLSSIRDTYGDASWRATQALASIMRRGGKRIRPALAEASYHMFGGTDERVVRGMGLALEMLHAYLLVTDDISDRSSLRRGGPTAHKVVEAWHHDAKLQGDAAHFGMSMSMFAAMTSSHEAILEVGKLPVSAERRMAAIENIHRLIAVTCHGQLNDIMNEADATQNKERIENVLLWKTAYYTFINPLQLGAILAEAPPKMLDHLADYGLAAGRAFQISDDIIGLFGDAKETGKDPADDIKEGKRTILTVKALELAMPEDAAFLESQLGNHNLTADAFWRCKNIVEKSGALKFARGELERSCYEAMSLAHTGELPEGDGRRFLSGLAESLKNRRA